MFQPQHRKPCTHTRVHTSRDSPFHQGLSSGIGNVLTWGWSSPQPVPRPVPSVSPHPLPLPYYQQRTQLRASDGGVLPQHPQQKKQQQQQLQYGQAAIVVTRRSDVAPQLGGSQTETRPATPVETAAGAAQSSVDKADEENVQQGEVHEEGKRHEEGGRGIHTSAIVSAVAPAPSAARRRLELSPDRRGSGGGGGDRKSVTGDTEGSQAPSDPSSSRATPAAKTRGGSGRGAAAATSASGSVATGVSGSAWRPGGRWVPGGTAAARPVPPPLRRSAPLTSGMERDAAKSFPRDRLELEARSPGARAYSTGHEDASPHISPARRQPRSPPGRQARQQEMASWSNSMDDARRRVSQRRAAESAAAASLLFDAFSAGVDVVPPESDLHEAPPLHPVVVSWSVASRGMQTASVDSGIAALLADAEAAAGPPHRQGERNGLEAGIDGATGKEGREGKGLILGGLDVEAWLREEALLGSPGGEGDEQKHGGSGPGSRSDPALSTAAERGTAARDGKSVSRDHDSLAEVPPEVAAPTLSTGASRGTSSGPMRHDPDLREGGRTTLPSPGMLPNLGVQLRCPPSDPSPLTGRGRPVIKDGPCDVPLIAAEDAGHEEQSAPWGHAELRVADGAGEASPVADDSFEGNQGKSEAELWSERLLGLELEAVARAHRRRAVLTRYGIG